MYSSDQFILQRVYHLQNSHSRKSNYHVAAHLYNHDDDSGGGGGRGKKRGGGGGLDCSICIQAGQPRNCGSISSTGKTFFSLLKTSRLSPRPMLLLLQWIMGAVSLKSMWPGHKVVHSLQSTTEVKNAWSYISDLHFMQYSIITLYWCRCCAGTDLIYSKILA